MYAFLALLAGMTLSCAGRHGADVDFAATGWFLPALSNSSSVVQYSHRITGQWKWLVDSEQKDFAVIAVGEDFPDHFTRGLTMKVLRNGAVYVLETDGGEESWRLDLPAVR